MVFFRADSNSVIAGGHIMRCLAIAKAMINAGEKVCFLIADENPISVLSEAEIDYFVLHSDWQDLMTDVEQVKNLLKRENNPILLVDTYSITKEYADELKPLAKVVYLGSKPEYLGNLDLLINYSTDIDYDFYHRNYSDKTTLLLGPSYAPLREEFQNASKDYNDRIKRILLTTGNTDRDRMVGAVLNSLLPLIEGTEIVIDAIIGRMFDDKESLHMKYDENQHVCFQENVKSMASLMKNCDLVISANGTTVYELSATGLPIITFAMVPEQIRSAEALSNLGIVDYCGRSYEDQEKCLKAIYNRVRYYLEHNDEMIKLAKKAHELIDGNGCQKIVEKILSLV